VRLAGNCRTCRTSLSRTLPTSSPRVGWWRVASCQSRTAQTASARYEEFSFFIEDFSGKLD
jgi:hypothetical protein